MLSGASYYDTTVEGGSTAAASGPFWGIIKRMKRDRAILPVVLIASLCSLSYELSLVRVFSVSLWYHFAFMVISIAMLGIGASGTLLAIRPGLREDRYIPLHCLMLGLSIPVSYLLTNSLPFDPARLAWDRVQLLYISLYYLLLSLPFLFFGLIVSTALSTMEGRTGYIYGADLTGAALGSLLTLLLLHTGGPERVVFILSAVSAFPLLFHGRWRMKTASAALILANILILSLQPRFITPRISPYKPLQVALRYPGAVLLKTYYSPYARVDIFRSPAVRYAPGLSLRYLEDLPEQTGISVDAGDIYAVTDDSDPGRLAFLRYLPSSLPYELSRKEDVLILDAKGGLDVLKARYYGARNIYTVESNPLVVRSVRDYSRRLTHHLYAENTWTGLGRSWLASGDRSFDLIEISVMGSMPSGSFGFSEDYRFTVEAFSSYIQHLKPGGMLSINLFIIPPPRTELRLIDTIREALREEGVEDPGSRVAAVRSWGSITIVVKNSPLTEGEIELIRAFARERRFDLVYYPGIREDETNVYIKMPTGGYADAFRRLLLDPETRARFVREYVFDISPVRDENPFFHYHLKLGRIGEIYAVMGEKWQYFLEEGYLLPVIFLQVLFIGLLLVLLPAMQARGGASGGAGTLRSLSYFALLGVGFMFIEISFIQRMILPLENPPYAVAAVVFSILIGSGIGSALSQRFERLRRPPIVLALGIVILAYSLTLRPLTDAVLGRPMGMKLLFTFFVLLPPGLLMGIPFPLGLSLLTRDNPRLVPWAWAVNGCFSVLAPILAVMFAVAAGFRTVMISGAMIYLLAFLSLPKKTYPPS